MRTVKNLAALIMVIAILLGCYSAEAEESPLDKIQMTKEEMRIVYDELNELLNDPASPIYADFKDYSVEAVEKYEEDCTKKIAEKYNLSEEEVNTIFSYGALGKLFESDQEYTLRYGELLQTTVNGTTLVIKAKIEPQLTNKLTIKQNYYNVCDIITDQGGDAFTEIQYWAVADMTDGSEGKVISFTLDDWVIEMIAKKKIYPAMLEDYAKDLYILPSLKK